jgi:hypothetical protein
LLQTSSLRPARFQKGDEFEVEVALPSENHGCLCMDGFRMEAHAFDVGRVA